MSDLRFGLRQMVRNPGFALVVIATLAIGIGANTMIFSFGKAVLMPPMPFDDRVVLVRMANPEQGWDDMGCLHADVLDWEREAPGFDGFAAAQFVDMRWSGSDHPQKLDTLRTSADFFDVLRAPVAFGRSYTEEEVAAGEPVVVLSHTFWSSTLGADPEVLGSTLRLDGAPYTVIGVAAPGLDTYGMWDPTDLFRPLTLAADYGRQGGRAYVVVARLREGVSRAQGEEQLEIIEARLREEFPETNRGYFVRVHGAREYLVDSDVPRAMLVLGILVMFVLTLASANAANLLLSRASARAQEMAVRTALGAGRLRILRQMLSESLLLALAAGAVGVLLAFWGLEVLTPLLPDYISGVDVIGIDPVVLLFTLGVSAVTAVLFGLAPALHTARADVNELLKESVRGGGSRQRWRAWLMGLEVGLAVMLLVAAGLAIQSLVRLRTVPKGFETRGLLVAQVSLPAEVYAEPGERRRFFAEVVERLEARPDVGRAAAMNTLPLYGTSAWAEVVIEGRPAPDPRSRQMAGYLVVSPGYFDLMGIPLVEGDLFTSADDGDRPPVALINESMARRYWPDRSPIGARFRRLGATEHPWTTVVGIVRDNLHRGLDEPPRPEFFLPFTQQALTAMQVGVRAPSGSAVHLEGALRGAVASVDPDQPVYAVYTMEGVIDEALTIWPLVVTILMVFSGIALLLACVGVYSVMSYAVSHRRREMAIRMALGAQGRDVIRLILKGGVRVVAVGLALGLAGALATAQLLRGLLFGIGPGDPATFLGTAALLFAVTLAACYVPARRATRVDPIAALRID